MADITEDVEMESQDVEQETPPDNIFIPPSIYKDDILAGKSYSHFSPVPQQLASDGSTECVLGVDEAGRGPVLGPMVYALFYLPLSAHHTLLAQTHHFDDSKKLTPTVRSNLMQHLCTPGSDLHTTCGWATRSLSAQDISAHMLAPHTYNLNAQAMDATIALIQGVLDKGVNVREIYIDTIGRPDTYQRRLEKIWPTISITVAKKADSLYPVVSAASVCAKVSRDAALEESYRALVESTTTTTTASTEHVASAWGSGYPGDAKTSAWLKGNMDPVFGWGHECRFSWGTAKELLEGKKGGVGVDWPDDEGDNRMFDFLSGEKKGDELGQWFGQRVVVGEDGF